MEKLGKRERADSQTGLLLCVTAMLLVGSTVPVSKLIGQTIDPFVATALRHAAAMPLLIAGVLWRKQPWPTLCGRDWLLLVTQAAAGSAGYTVLLIAGVQLASAADASVVTGTLPAMAALLSILFLGERPGLRTLLSVSSATVGVVLLGLAAPSETPAGPAETRYLGMLLILCAVACEAVFILGQGRLKVQLSALQMSLLMSAGGLLICIVPAAVRWPSVVPAWNDHAVAGVIYYAWVGTVGAFVLWYAGAAQLSAAKASATTAVLPVSAFLLSVLLLDESIHSLQVFAMCFVLAAIALPLIPPRGAVSATSQNSSRS